MEVADIERKYITPRQIAGELGVDTTTVHNWIKYHRYMPEVRLLERPVVERAAYERFKTERPDLKKTPA